jgi:hypothetical protein
MYFLYKNEYRSFKLIETTIRKGLKKKEKYKGNEPKQATIHVYMEVPHGNSLCSYLKQAKMSFLFLFFCKIGEQEGETGSAREGVDTSGRREEVEKGC